MRKILYVGTAAIALALQIAPTSASAAVRQRGQVLTVRIPPAATTPEPIAFNTSDAGFGPTTFVAAVEPPAVEKVSPFVSVVPEPASWAMMIFGFAMTGAVMRRRQHMRLRVA